MVHVSTPKAILNYDSDMMPMKWRVASRKLNFVSRIMKKDCMNLAKSTLIEEGRLDSIGRGMKGLVYETTRLSLKLCIGAPIILPITKQEISEAIW